MAFAGSASAANGAGHWAVAGSIDGTNFTLDCHFDQVDQKLTGTCVDGPTGDEKIKGGRSHDLLEGEVSGDNIRWTYQTSYLLFKFDVKYMGTLDGTHAKGTLAAAGKTGTFTANQVP
jgi:hypothetical protein